MVAAREGASRVVRVRADDLRRFVVDVLMRRGTPREAARTVAHVLVLSDRRGILSHGVARLPVYVAAINDGSVDPSATPQVVAQRGATQLWDAGHGLGHPVSMAAMERAIAISGESGIGLVLVRNSSHFGIAAAYVERALDMGRVGVVTTNADPHVLPVGARRPGLGTNPISIGGRGTREDFLLDMTTSVVPGGRLEVAARRSERVPFGWAVDAEGKPTDDPVAGLNGGLLPLGSTLEMGAHKGYGLAAAVDILTGVLSGGAWGPQVRSLVGSGGTSNLSHLFLAIDPGAFGGREEFSERLSEWAQAMRSLSPDPPAAGVLIPGERETASVAALGEAVVVEVTVFQELRRLASELQVEMAVPDHEEGHG
jgi:LDH2 family malate/lactate/ureidoglycolate dehydrogenase